MASPEPIETASDGTRLYAYKEAVEAFDSMEAKTFSITDLVLVLLGAQDKPVHGRTLLMKEAFLLYEEALKGRSCNPRFVKYRLGPHSFHVEEALRVLATDGVLDRRGRPNSRSELFRLTDRGSRIAAGVIENLPVGERRLVSEKRAGWDQLGTDGMLNYVYAKYPEYRDKSVSKARYADVVWGRE